MFVVSQPRTVMHAANDKIPVAGLVVLVRDCVVSFQRERQLIWSAPSSPSKWIYLINRYLSPVCFLTFFIPLSGFSGLNLDNDVSLRPYMHTLG
jgi:hypothetical protein